MLEGPTCTEMLSFKCIDFYVLCMLRCDAFLSTPELKHKPSKNSEDYNASETVEQV